MGSQQPGLDKTGTIRDLIDRMAEIRADQPFLIEPETNRILTFRELRQRAIDFSRRLLSLGMSKGDRVSFLLDNGSFSLEMILGAMYGGFVPAPLNLAAGQSPMAANLDHSDAIIVFVADEYKDLLSRITTQIQRRLEVVSVHPDRGPEWNGTGSSTGSLPALDEQDDVLLLYTSGTTGRPKGVVHGHRNLLAAAVNAVSFYQLSGQDRSLCVLPIYHINGLAISSLPTLLSGGSLVIPRRFNVASFWNWVVTYRCTWFALVPTIISQLVNRPALRGDGTELSHVRFARSSSAPIAPSLHKTFEEEFGLALFEAMGMTEVGDILSTPPVLAKRKIGSPGIPRQEAKFVDAFGHDLPPRETGEMVCRGPSVMKGYHKDPAATAAALTPDGWLKTGDLGYKDEDGYFFITGRAKEIIIKGGEKVSPREIDETLESHPAVREAAAVGVPDRHLGEEIIAYVVAKPEARCQEQELLVFCANVLGDFKTPARIYFTDDLPKGPSGKLQRLKLLDRRESHTDVERDIGASAHHDAQSPSQPEFVEPRTSLEAQLTAIWTALLQVPGVGIHGDFFALGGHSLLAARILARIREAFQVSLSLRVFFEAPTVAKLARRIELANSQGQGLQPLAIPSAPNEGASPLSFPQERLWFLDQFESGSVEYNIAAVRRFRGNLVVQALEDSFTEIIRRQASLRTTFPAINGAPLQSIAAPKPFRLSVVELSTLSEEKKRTELARLAKQEALRPFDLTRGPLLRAVLLRLNEDDHVLLLTVHHIVSDRWSMEILFWELGVLYSAFSANRPSPLSDLPIQYAGLAAWQRQWLQGENLERQLAYWKQQLADIPPLLELPSDRPRPSIQTHRGAHQLAIFSLSVAQALNELSRREQVTLFMTLLAGFQTLLFRYTGQTDIVVGAPTANRTRTETENLIGFFINMLVLRADLSGNPTFRELLQRVQRSALGAYEHQDIPFEKLVAELRPVRAMSQSPLFQVVFQLRNVPERMPEFSGLQVEVLRSDSGAAQFDLSIAVRATAAGLEVEAEYNTDLFDASTIERMLGHYETLLEGIVADPEQRISELPLLTESERHQLLVEWNDTKTDYPTGKCIHELFESQVERSPDAVALAFEDQQLTYRELNNRANQLAHYLQKLGVGRGVRVGIYVERSVEMIVGLLGILKAGGAYLALDPSYPKERLAFMVEDAQARVLLTQKKFLSNIGHRSVVCLDRDWQEIAKFDAGNLENKVSTDDLAYVIYTSGSTGTPKGALITHYNVARLFQATEAWFRFDSNDVWTLFHSYAFDFSVWEMWGALFYGGKLVIVPHEISRSPKEFAALLIRQRITVLNQTPSAFRQLISCLTGSATRDPMALRFVIFGGEALELQSLKAWFECYSDDKPKLINMYGITETTVHVTYRPIKRGDIESAAGSVIGKPLADLRVYLLDKHQALVPIGVAGEIYVGGAGVGKGYLGLAELTAERFIIDPFSDHAQAKCYRSGDLARWLPDGDLEYLGRIDDQVKIRGFRVELGEIEAVLGQHPLVRSSVVVVREDTPGEKRLVAYMVGRQGNSLEAAEIRKYLKQKLPEYMIPAAFVRLDALPLTPNGKVDRSALPARDQARPELEIYQAPRTAAEETIAGIWSELLKLDKIDIRDNFFDLGGHSLLATQVIARVRSCLSVELPLRSLFESPTVEQMAAAIVEQQKLEHVT